MFFFFHTAYYAKMKGIAAIHIPPGIQIPNITPTKNKTLTLCFIARNHIWIKRKGLRYLLNALMIIKQKYPQLDYKLHIIGNIPWYSQFILNKYKPLKDHIQIHGLLPRNN